jgi:homoserine dehydrogenase
VVQRPRPAARARPLTLRVAICGLGAVGREFLRLVVRTQFRLAREEALLLKITGVASRSRGARSRAAGFNPQVLLSAPWKRACCCSSERLPAASDATLAWIRQVPADVLVEATPLSPRTGQPALTYLETALQRGLHVVTANKGPLAWGWSRLSRAAERSGARLYYEGTALDGMPVFSLRGEALAGCRVLAFRGVLNSTTQYLLQEVEAGRSASAALADMEQRGIAEADPRHDLEGWDAALKVAVLANALLGGALRPDHVRRRGIERLTEAEIRRAAAGGRPWRLVAEGGREAGKVWGRVGPQRLDPRDPLAHLPGTSNALTLDVDPLGKITLIEMEPDLRQTAAAVLMDLVRLGRVLRG